MLHCQRLWRTPFSTHLAQIQQIAVANPVTFHPSMNHPARLRQRASFTCILPGLIWPGQGVDAALGMYSLPALSYLLGRAGVDQCAPQPFLHWLAAQFGTVAPPWGKLRWCGESLKETGLVDLGEGTTLCADPVSIEFVRDSLILKGDTQLALSEQEAMALIESLNRELSEIGTFYAATPQRWYLHTKSAVRCHFHPLSDVLGRPVALFQPEGEAAREWSRLDNEIQVLLFNHPVNLARAERGMPLANGLWLWGNGSSEKLRSPADTLVSTDPLLLGLGQATGTPALVPTTAGSPVQGRSGRTWWLDRRLEEAALMGNLSSWSETLARLEAELFRPLLTAWQQGRLDEVHIVSPSDKCLLEARLGHSARWMFWRGILDRPALHSLLSIASKTRQEKNTP